MQRFRWSGLTAAVVVMLGCLLAAVASASITEAIDAACRITAPGGGRGTGCVFERSQGHLYVLTCAHVVGNSRTVSCEFWRQGHQSRRIAARVVQVACNADAAVLAIPEASFGGYLPPVVPIAPGDFVLRSGETISSVGCASRAWSTGWNGHVLGYDGGDLYFVPTPANGRSASAIFDAQTQRIVGLLKARTADDSKGIATSGRHCMERCLDVSAATRRFRVD